MFDYLPLEILCHVFDYVDDVDELFSHGKVCVNFYNALNAYIDINIRSYVRNMGNIKKLFMSQVKSLFFLKKNISISTGIQTDYGEGKKLVILTEAERCWREYGWRTLVLIPYNVLSAWRDELDKRNYKFIGTRPKNSDVIIYHSKFKEHQKYFLNISNNGELYNYPITLLPVSFNHYFLTSDELKIFNSGMFDQLMVSNTFNSYGNNLFVYGELMSKKFRRSMFFFSERNIRNISDISGIHSSFELKSYVSFKSIANDQSSSKIINNIQNVYPRIKDIRKSISDILDLELSISDVTPKIVLFINNKSYEYNKYFEDISNDWDVFRFYFTNTFALNKWRQSKKPSILFASFPKDIDGNNFDVATSGIYIYFNTLSLSESRKCFNRLSKYINPNSTIRNYLLCNQNFYTSDIETRINAEYATYPELNIKKKRKQRLKHIKSAMINDGISPLDLSQADFITCFCDTYLNYPLPFQTKDYKLPLPKIIEYMSIVGKYNS